MPQRINPEDHPLDPSTHASDVGLIHIPFHGDEILVVDADGKPHIVLRPAVESIGLDYWSQVEKLRKRSWAATSNRQVQLPGQRQRREVLTCDLRTFLMLLATVDENRVAEDTRAKLITYQAEVADVIEAYWTRGHAVNHRAINRYEPVTYSWPEVVAKIWQDYHVDMSEHTLTRLLRAAGVLKMDAREPKAAHRHMFWFADTHWEVHKHAVPMLLRKAEDVGRQLQEFRFLQTRLELDAFSTPDTLSA